MKNFLQLIGLRTTCCNAKIVTWHHNKHYCAACEAWLEKPLQQETSLSQPSGVQRQA